MPAMRLSVFLLPAATAWKIFAATIPPAADPFWAKRYAQKGRNLNQADYLEWQQELLTHLTDPRPFNVLKGLVRVPENMLKLVLNRMCFEGLVLRLGAHSMRSNSISYVASTDWSVSKQKIDPEQALCWLAGEYLAAFGPARVRDFQWWAGVGALRAKAAFAANETIDIGDGLLLLKNNASEFETFTASTTDTVDILPQWDCYIMGYAPDGRSRFASPDTLDKIYGKLGATGGNASGVILINGLAIGTWQYRFTGKKIIVTTSMFETLTAGVRQAIAEQFGHIVQVLGAEKLELNYT